MTLGKASSPERTINNTQKIANKGVKVFTISVAVIQYLVTIGHSSQRTVGIPITIKSLISLKHKKLSQIRWGMQDGAKTIITGNPTQSQSSRELHWAGAELSRAQRNRKASYWKSKCIRQGNRAAAITQKQLSSICAQQQKRLWNNLTVIYKLHLHGIIKTVFFIIDLYFFLRFFLFFINIFCVIFFFFAFLQLSASFFCFSYKHFPLYYELFFLLFFRLLSLFAHYFTAFNVCVVLLLPACLVLRYFIV